MIITMKIGLIIATESEFKVFLDSNFDIVKIEKNRHTTYLYSYESNYIIAISSGIGEIASSAATQYLIDRYNVDLIINFGVVGALKSNLKTCDVCLVKSIIDGEIDTSAIDKCEPYVHFNLGFKNKEMDTSNKYYALIKTNFPELTEVTCLSTNKFIDGPKLKSELANKFCADICEMEAAGIYLTSKINGVPSIFLKAISDSVEGGENEYKNFVTKASNKVIKILKKVLKII